ncbi:MAG: hypothetical protein WCP90_05405 [Opitutae bacterium]|jgi:hypothetical protein
MDFFTRIARLFSPKRDAFMGPENRDWRQLIKQDVRTIPQDELGRKRAARSRMPIILTILFFVFVIVVISLSLEEGTPVSSSIPITYSTDGFLPSSYANKVINDGTDSWAKDVATIKTDLEKDPQVLTAKVRRLGTGGLEVKLLERLAVARIAILPPSGPYIVKLVSPEGVLFSGTGYPQQSTNSLPVITDFRTTGAGEKVSVDGLEVVGPFLFTARTVYPNQYKQWATISLRDCFGSQEDAMGSNLRINIRPGSQPIDRATLSEIIFSTTNWRNELEILSKLDVDGLLRKSTGGASSYVLKLSIQNRTTSRPIPEPRLVPISSR